GFNVFEQALIDKVMIELDGTENKSNLGANAILGVSLAVAHAAATELGLPLFRYVGGTNAKVLPVPMMNIVNAGSYSYAPSAFQGFRITRRVADSLSHTLQKCTEIFRDLTTPLPDRTLSTAGGDEGGFAPAFGGTGPALATLLQATTSAGYQPS